MTRWDLCNDRLDPFNPSVFLEIGVKRGSVGKRIRADLKFGVDPEPASHAHTYYTTLYKQTSDEFFAEHPTRLNLSVVLIDGLHHADQVMRDVLNSLYHLSNLGTIVLHDCNPPDEASQIVPRQQGHWNGDCWKVIVQLRATRPDLKVYTIDADEGLGVVQWSAQEPLITGPGELTWDGLVRHRTEWWGLCRP